MLTQENGTGIQPQVRLYFAVYRLLFSSNDMIIHIHNAVIPCTLKETNKNSGKSFNRWQLKSEVYVENSVCHQVGLDYIVSGLPRFTVRNKHLAIKTSGNKQEINL